MSDAPDGRRHRLRLVPNLERATHAVAVYVQSNGDVECTQAEANVLAFLHERGDSPLADVHASFGHRRSTLTSVIARLEDRKLVVRRRNPDDGRAFVLSLTRAGSTTARAVSAHLTKLEKVVASRLTESDVASFVKVTGALVEAARGVRKRRPRSAAPVPAGARHGLR